MMKHRQNWLTVSLVAILISIQPVFAQVKKVADPEKVKMDKFISALMAKMTLDEKIGQLNLPSIGFDVTGPLVSQDVDKKIKSGLVGGVFNTYTPEAVRKLQDMAVKETRLKIPLIFGYDVIHGHKTIFPIPLAMSCTWDMNLIEQSARIAAQEASADGLNWTFSPMVDIARDPRWGRVAEGSGEDPFLGSQIAKAMVKGYQGDDLTKNNTILACVKHFALYGAAESGRDYNTVDMSPVKMFNDYLPPYKAAFDAGAGSAMSSFNEINGVPATANKWLMTDLLRKQWGFEGFVVTDYTAINEMIDHGIGRDLKDVSELALNAGIDMDMVGEGFILNAKTLVNEGKVTIKTIDDACRRILEAKYKLGLFEDPYRYISETRAKNEILTPGNRTVAKEIAEQSMVLLKNDKQLLPLKPVGTIALIGPLADNKREMIGTWSAAGDWQQSVSLKEGISKLFGDKLSLLTAKGCNLLTDRKFLSTISGADQVDSRSDENMIEEAIATAQKADVIVAVLGEPLGISGEAASRSEIGLPGMQLTLLKALVATGKPVVLVLMNGRPLTLEWENENVQAILEAWHGGHESGNALASVLFGLTNPAGKLTMTFPRNIGQIPIYYNHKNTGRPFAGNMDEKYKSRYLDVTNDPLYPFGYGLSYTTFKYSDLKLDKSSMNIGGNLIVSFTLSNTGKYDGTEVAQLYTRDKVGNITRPVKELKGYQKIHLKAGESKTLTFTLSSKDLAFYNENLENKSEPGMFEVFVGGSSAKGLEASFELLK
jgi:beta-glucosidase